MIELVAQLKVRHGLKVGVVINEARELNAYRIRRFKLDGFVDFFISSCFVHLRKSDVDIFRIALDAAQTRARRVVDIENTPMFVQIAEGLGIRSILHTDYRKKWIGAFAAALGGLDTLVFARTRPRSAPGFAMGWVSLESNSTKSEMRRMTA